MSDQALAKTTPPSDGFDAPDDERSGAVFIKFEPGSQNLWFDRSGQPIPRKPWIAVECHKEAVRWQDKKIIDRIDGTLSPDIDALYAAIPEDEWEEGFDGQAKAPWSLQYSVYMVNPDDGSKITSSNSTYGQRAAYADLKDKVSFMRKYRGAPLVPVVELSSKMMKTRFGMKPRPHFEILDWRNFGKPEVSAIAAPVEPLTTKEIVNDEIPDHPAPNGAPFDDGLPF